MSDGKRRVLLVDDEPSILKTIGKRLEIEGFEVITAADGEEAIAKALAERPDLIVLDLMLPKANGFDVCAKLKQHQRAQEVPIVIMFSGKGREEDAERSRELGAMSFVPKGHGASLLIETIKAALADA